MQRSWRLTILGVLVLWIGLALLGRLYMPDPPRGAGWFITSLILTLGGLSVVVLGSPTPRFVFHLHDPSDPKQKAKIALLLAASAVLSVVSVQRARPPTVRLRLVDSDMLGAQTTVYRVVGLAWDDSVARICSPLREKVRAADLVTDLIVRGAAMTPEKMAVL